MSPRTTWLRLDLKIGENKIKAKTKKSCKYKIKIGKYLINHKSKINKKMLKENL